MSYDSKNALGGILMDIYNEIDNWAEIDLNELEINQQIGGGGYAIVHEGKYKGKSVAVSDEAKKEFLDELYVMARLYNPNCISLIGAHIKPPKMCYVMELLNCSLYDILYNDIATAFQYLHSFSPKIIHRDLKTRNVLLTDDWHLKLCDFGLCNNPNALIGTPCYMAPELLNEKPFNHKVDVYSYGLFMWEIFARQIPFEGIDPKRIKELLNEGSHPDTKKLHSCPVELNLLIQRCWNYNPDVRPEFTEVLKTVRDLENQTPEEGKNCEDLTDSLDALLFSK